MGPFPNRMLMLMLMLLQLQLPINEMKRMKKKLWMNVLLRQVLQRHGQSSKGTIVLLKLPMQLLILSF